LSRIFSWWYNIWV